MTEHALVLTRGPVTPVLGDRSTVAARELVGGDDMMPVRTNQLRVTAARLVEHAIAEQDLDALVLIAGDVDLGVGSGETAETTREIFGDPD